MNGLVIILIAAVVLICGYVFYGRYLAKKWGIDPNAKTPAYTEADGVDCVPADTNVVFGHQFASIAGAGPINGPIQAAIFGWVPVLLWILIGGVFFGAVQDFSAMYASVRNKGKQSLNIYISIQLPCPDKTINLFEYGYNKLKELVNNSTIEELENIDINLKLLKDSTDC